MEQAVKRGFFHLDGDNVFFRGIDSGKKFEGGYDCPLFNTDTGKMVAQYVSAGGLKIYYEDKMQAFVVMHGMKKTVLPVFEVEGERYFGFWGWPWIMEGKNKTDAG